MNPVDLLSGLVKIYSPSTQERDAVNFLVAKMSELGFNAFVDNAGNAVGTLGVESGDRS